MCRDLLKRKRETFTEKEQENERFVKAIIVIIRERATQAVEVAVTLRPW